MRKYICLHPLSSTVTASTTDLPAPALQAAIRQEPPPADLGDGALL